MLLDLHIPYFQNPDLTELSYNSINGAFYPYISLKLQKVTFGARKMKKKNTLKKFLVFREMALSSCIYIKLFNVFLFKFRSKKY